MRMVRSLLGVCAATLAVHLGPDEAGASSFHVYTYTGPNYVFADPPYDTSMSPSGSITFDQDRNLVDYSFSDGILNYSLSNDPNVSGIVTLSLDFDSNDAIIGWDIDVYQVVGGDVFDWVSGFVPFGGSPGPCLSGPCFGSVNQIIFNGRTVAEAYTDDPATTGFWSGPTPPFPSAVIPLPATAMLLGSSLLALLCLRRRKA